MAAYETKLTQEEEEKFKRWKAVFAPKDSGADYDLRGAFKAGLRPDPNSGHWPDTFKKPNHPTFSNESVYAKDVPAKAGHWEGDKFIPPNTTGDIKHMPYNYIDFIRDQARRNAQRRGTVYDSGRYRDGAPNRDTSSLAYPDRQPFRNPFQNLGERLDPSDLIGRPILASHDPTSPSGSRAEAFAYQRPRRLFGSGFTNTEQRALGYNPDAPITVGASPINPAPARQAIDQAVQGNAGLSTQGSKTVVSDDGYLTTYLPSGGIARSKVPSGTNIQRTDNGHTVLSFPNGLHRIVGSDGNVVDYKPQAVQDSVKDFSNPVMQAEQAANYLNASRNVIPPITAAPGTRFNALEGTSLDSANPAVPIVGTPVRDSALPSGYGFGQGIRNAITNAPGAIGRASDNAYTGLINNVGVPVYNVLAGVLGTTPANPRRRDENGNLVIY